MGLDIALGVIVLVAGVRGWFRGFILQAIRLGALVGCVFAAGPIRDLALPYTRRHLSGVEPALVDKLIWWTAVVVGYTALSGASTSLVKIYRRKTYAEFEPNRGDRGAGFLLGALKGALVAVFLAAGINAQAPEYLKSGGWVGEQVRTSRALALSDRYRPADRVWQSGPVRALVIQIRANGFWSGETAGAPDPARPPAEANRFEPEPMRTAAERPRALILPPPASRIDPKSPDFLGDFDTALRREGIAIPPPGSR